MEKIIKQITTMKEVVEDIAFWKTADGTEFQNERDAYLYENDEYIRTNYISLVESDRCFNTQTGYIVYLVSVEEAKLVTDGLELEGYVLDRGDFPETYPAFVGLGINYDPKYNHKTYIVNLHDNFGYAERMLTFRDSWV